MPLHFVLFAAFPRVLRAMKPQYAQLLAEGELRPPVLVFVATKERATALHRELLYDGVHVDSIHAGQLQVRADSPPPPGHPFSSCTACARSLPLLSRPRSLCRARCRALLA